MSHRPTISDAAPPAAKAVHSVEKTAARPVEKATAAPERARPVERARPAEQARPERVRPADKPIRHPEARSARAPENLPAEKALFAKNERAMRYAVENAACSPNAGAGDIRKLQGSLGEGLHHYSRGGGIGLVHDLNTDLGRNNAVFDASSRQELTSIKTHLRAKESAAANAYANDLREMVGAQDSHKVNGAADRLWAMKEQGGERWRRAETFLPQGVREARTPEQMRAAVVDEAALRIPADQVEAARACVVRNAMRHPETYGLDPLSGPAEREAQANMMAMKIKPLADSVTSHDLRLMTRQCYQKRYGLI